ncbi:hypothetical protein JVX91_00710 [Pseudomonas sp. PDNC002]|uniref:hypothetical protein n=1 Tax=Pseudomonas sp. PDNC002 TaxID=2811422 RepID=UPI0019641343|nr:hypothetical protein [Pseudomonas sp. PDNC002]QRY79667.1 hypothetical protein JVX91_00710 [Pseudomonas sp. PDNC002]
MARSQKERSKAAAEKRQRLDETELRHQVRHGTRAMLENLMLWHGLFELSEAVQLLILNTHALGEEASAKFFTDRSPAGDARDELLRHRLRPGPRQDFAELMRWHGIEEQAEAIQLLIMHAHDLGPDGSAPLLAIPRHDFTPSEFVARELERLGRQEAARMEKHDA